MKTAAQKREWDSRWTLGSCSKWRIHFSLYRRSSNFSSLIESLVEHETWWKELLWLSDWAFPGESIHLSLSLHHCRRLDLNSSISRWIHLCFLQEWAHRQSKGVCLAKVGILFITLKITLLEKKRSRISRSIRVQPVHRTEMNLADAAGFVNWINGLMSAGGSWCDLTCTSPQWCYDAQQISRFSDLEKFSWMKLSRRFVAETFPSEINYTPWGTLNAIKSIFHNITTSRKRTENEKNLSDLFRSSPRAAILSSCVGLSRPGPWKSIMQ